MIIKAEQKNTRQTARKVRLVAFAVKDMSLEDAIRHLAVMDRRASLAVLKVIRQAVANAINNHGLSFDNLEIENIIVNEGPTYKRWRAVSRGRAHTILKRSCHIRVELKTKDNKKAEEAVKKAKEDKKVEAKKAEKKSTQKAPAAKKADVKTKKAQEAIKAEQSMAKRVQAPKATQNANKLVQNQKKGTK
jgi:large subunit ribosomal protein L22